MQKVDFRKYILSEKDDYMCRYIQTLGKQYFENYMARVYERMEKIPPGGSLNLLAKVTTGERLIPQEREELFLKLACQFISDYRAINKGNKDFRYDEYYFNEDFTIIKRL